MVTAVELALTLGLGPKKLLIYSPTIDNIEYLKIQKIWQLPVYFYFRSWTSCPLLLLALF